MGGLKHPHAWHEGSARFATVASMFSPSQPIRPVAEDKLAALRRLDKSRRWNSLDDQLYCTICKTVISGRQIEVVGGTNGLRALHLKCSTPGCFSTPADWLLPVKSDTVRELDILFRVRVGIQTKPNKGTFQLAINGVSQGAVQDEYNASVGYAVRDLGTVYLNSGNQAFKFTVAGKNASSTGYTLAFDYIELVP